MSFPDSRIFGRDAVVSISVDGGTTYLVAGCASSVTVSRATATEEVAPCIGSGDAAKWAAKEIGQKSWSASMDSVYNPGVGVDKVGFDTLENAWSNDIKPMIKLVYTAGADTITDEGLCIITALDESISGANEAITFSLSLDGTGEISHTKVEA